jgi:hypothetical protein
MVSIFPMGSQLELQEFPNYVASSSGWWFGMVWNMTFIFPNSWDDIFQFDELHHFSEG